ncbi:C-C motif chemokine 19-like [Acanthochromis polyacanthus]|uniref:C-C motif chemokine 19-like n=1 Tax=Acanthochromis polyacanthus TaxID=80966 RepID=A0A3Q1HG03_9TELE|nr:C-C motif chemokine 19-like [Acanthochromis polyacanthus]
MALWGDTKLFLCILVITFGCTVILAEIPKDCCLKVANVTIERGRIGDYRRQVAGAGCRISAAVLVTRHQRTLCVPDNEPWVQELMKHVDQLKAWCKKRKNTGKRCSGVNRQ